MSESLRDRVARVLTEHTIYAPMMSDFECSCGFEADDNDAVEVTPNEHIADALIADGLVAEPRERVRDSEVLDRMGDRIGPNDYPLANLIYDASSRMRRNENEQEAAGGAL